MANSLIAKLARVTPVEVDDMRAWVRSSDPNAVVPEMFANGRHAFALALLKVEQSRPALFWGGLLAFLAIPCLVLHTLLR
ncbi:hypothetical protein CupriaWKF_31615 [Cupriavidus sp. WKF15]|uniref:hypothetical protein n=1 Tax=Cupriavidus sp. WKF15 TaxID=3032282 RepID=UPI0023E341EA|nr:hypothetical protein [Cupriavidus sp. WKF15]WER50881.1 hypothetical protein CupriaWKF_31615 [Cupriavidus sp. WKF15]